MTSDNRDRGRRNNIQKNKAKRKRIVIRTLIYTFILFLLAAAVFITSALIKRHQSAKLEEKSKLEEAIKKEENELNARRELIAEADKLALSYDYDAAIDLLNDNDEIEKDSEIIDALAKYTAAKSNLEQVDVTAVPHLYFHSLIIDTGRALRGGDTVRNNAWYTTKSEFESIISTMYKNGYVIVRMKDLVTEKDNGDGTVTISSNDSLKLPAGKKPYVLSFDDFSYYHILEGEGFAEKAVIDADGKVKCLYTDASGKTDTGDYDVVPILDSFIEEHPDASYKGAKGLIAMTGINGCFGYRTDPAYRTREGLTERQLQFLSKTPGFSWDDEVAEAKKVAEALKENGWEFACHTYGHINVSGQSVEVLEEDLKKWEENVAPIVGTVDTLIYTRGNDIGDWHDYDEESNPAYKMYKDHGFNYFCNTDASSKYWVQIRNGYIRQARIDCGGYQLYRSLSKASKTDIFEDMFDSSEVFDKARPTPVTL